MIARIIRWSATNLMLVLIATVFAVGVGLYALTKVPLDAIPDLSDTQVIVFTEFSGQPQCFLTSDQIIAEVAAAGFNAEATYPLRELNRSASGLRTSGVPVIYEGVFRYAGK